MGYRTEQRILNSNRNENKHFKVFNFISTEENTNERCSEMSSCPVRRAILRNPKAVTAAEDVDREGHTHCWWETSAANSKTGVEIP